MEEVKELYDLILENVLAVGINEGDLRKKLRESPQVASMGGKFETCFKEAVQKLISEGKIRVENGFFIPSEALPSLDLVSPLRRLLEAIEEALKENERLKAILENSLARNQELKEVLLQQKKALEDVLSQRR